MLALLLFLPSIILVAAVCPSCEQQCQCQMSKADSRKPCMGYDSRYMASSIDEAMFTFPNLVSNQGKPLFDKSTSQQPSPPNVPPEGVQSRMGIMSGPVPASDISPVSASGAAPPPPSDPQGGAQTQEMASAAGFAAKIDNKFTSPPVSGSCQSQECMACKLAIVEGFIDNDNSQEKNDLWLAKSRLQQETGLSSGNCGGAENAPIPPTTTQRPPKETKLQKENEKRVKQVVSILNSFGRKKRETAGNTTATQNATQNAMDKLLGVTTQIGCDYRRGSALNTDNRWSGLCNLCWQWRRLPEEYFPNYINEVSCDRGDCGCLSGFGTCMPVTRVLNVLKNKGTRENPLWEEATIDTVAACECQVETTNPIHSFVAK